MVFPLPVIMEFEALRLVGWSRCWEGSFSKGLIWFLKKPPCHDCPKGCLKEKSSLDLDNLTVKFFLQHTGGLIFMVTNFAFASFTKKYKGLNRNVFDWFEWYIFKMSKYLWESTSILSSCQWHCLWSVDEYLILKITPSNCYQYHQKQHFC